MSESGRFGEVPPVDSAGKERQQATAFAAGEDDSLLQRLIPKLKRSQVSPTTEISDIQLRDVVYDQVYSPPIFSEPENKAKARKWLKGIQDTKHILDEDLSSSDMARRAEAVQALNVLSEYGYDPAQGFASGFLGRRIDHLMEGAGQRDPTERFTFLEGISKVAKYGKGMRQKVAEDILRQHKRNILNGARHNRKDSQYFPMIAGLLHTDDGKQQLEVELAIEDMLQDSKRGNDNKSVLVKNLLQTKDVNVYWVGISFVEGLLEPFDVDMEAVLESWEIGGWRASETIRRNIRRVLALEERTPGIVKVLSEEFGIHNFDRYTTRQLERQYDQRDDRSRPYGIILFPRSDYNDAFTGSDDLLSELQEDVDSHGYNLRIVEAGSKLGVARHLINLTKRYGKISFALIGGHGTVNSIAFGEDQELRIADLKGRGVGRASEFFVPNPTIILNSCETGKKNGIGQKLHESFGAKVIAPEESTRIESIQVVSSNQGPDFEVGYGLNGEEHAAKVYMTSENNQ